MTNALLTGPRIFASGINHLIHLLRHYANETVTTGDGLVYMLCLDGGCPDFAPGTEAPVLPGFLKHYHLQP